MTLLTELGVTLPFIRYTLEPRDVSKYNIVQQARLHPPQFIVKFSSLYPLYRGKFASLKDKLLSAHRALPPGFGAETDAGKDSAILVLHKESSSHGKWSYRRIALIDR